jgi:Tol biopolymer transport system component
VQGSDLFRARISDGAVRVLWETPEREEMWPYWSDAAEKLVFEARLMGQPATDSDRAIEQRLWLWDPATASESLLSKSPALLEHWANWSPQGDRIVFAFSSRPDEPGDAGLAIAEVGSGRRTVAASSPAATRMFRPRFSPDGRRLVAQRWSRSSATSKVWIFDAATPRPLGRGRFGVDGKPRFTRDGESVVFTRRAVARGEGDIWIIGADGRGARRVFSVEGADDHAADPSPTRDEIAFSSNRSGDYEIWLADLASGELRNLTHTPETAEGAARWSPDGERLVVSVTPAGVDSSELEAHERPTPRLAVLDREGRVLFETEGYSADWMPPWK